MSGQHKQLAMVCQVPTNLTERAKGMDGLVLGCLWSNPDVNAVGVTPTATQAVASYTRLETEDSAEIFRRLEQSGQIIWDQTTGEACVPDWLNTNYLVENTPAERPDWVMSAFESVKSMAIRSVLMKEIARLDVQCDASAN